MWKSTIKDPVLRNRIEDKLGEISSILSNKKLFENPDLGLLEGESGAILFNSYYDERIKQEKSAEQTEQSLLRFFNSIDSNKSMNLSVGLSGVLWLVDHLREQNFIELDEELFENFSGLLHSELIRLSKAGNFDYLHGSFGVGLYLLKKSHLADHTVLQNWLKLYIASCENSDTVLCRKTVLNVTNNDFGYCLGLAHGVPSVILIALKYLQVFRQDDTAHEVLDKSLNYLLSNKTKTPRNFFFPNSIVNGVPSEGRLAWCYGDLGCALSLFLSGEVLKRQSLRDHALEVALSAAQRENDLALVDADFCHGTAGIAHFFARFYNYTGREEFRIAAERWFEKTINLATYSDGLAGFKHYYGQSDPRRRNVFEPSMGLLEGISGIGLTLMSALDNREPAWDNSFLLS